MTYSFVMKDDKFVVKVKSRRFRKNDRRNLFLNPVYFNVGIYLLVPLFLGIFVGYKLDERLHSRPLFVILGIIFGTISAFYNLWKLLKTE